MHYFCPRLGNTRMPTEIYEVIRGIGDAREFDAVMAWFRGEHLAREEGFARSELSSSVDSAQNRFHAYGTPHVHVMTVSPHVHHACPPQRYGE